MPIEHPFDKNIKQTFDGFEPNVNPDWTGFESSMNSASTGSTSTPMNATSISRWALMTAVAAGGALMWVAKPIVEDAIESNSADVAVVQHSDNAKNEQSFDEVWNEFAHVDEEFSDENDNRLEVTSAEQTVEQEDAVAEIPQSLQNPALASRQLSGEMKETELKSSIVVASDESAEAEITAEEEIWTEERILSELPFDASVRQACEGVDVAFELSGIDRKMSFLWNFGDGHFSSDPAPRHTFNEPGTYDITLSVRPPGEGSISTRTIQNMITVLPKPKADFAWAFPSTSGGDEVTVQLRNQTETAVQSSWKLADETISGGAIELKVPGVYAIELETNNAHGCVDDVRKEIHVGDLNGLLAQARFSPNGDGKYDTFMPHGLKEMKGAWELVISTEQGEEVYRTSDADMPWDGTLPNGELVTNHSVFVWTARCMDANGNTRLYTDRLLAEL